MIHAVYTGNVPADNSLSRVRERQRRAKLHRQIGALETRLKRIGPAPRFIDRQRAWKLLSKIRRLEWQLRHLPLSL